MSDSVLYNLKVVLQKPLTDVECWNCTDNSTGTVPEGTVVEIQNPNDATHTTICVENGPALTCVSRFYVPQPPACSIKPGLMGLRLNPKPDGSKPQSEFGFRFIVPNRMLREATGLSYPDQTRDLIGDILRFEEGQMTVPEAREFLTELKDNGTLFSYQGAYQRAARQLGII